MNSTKNQAPVSNQKALQAADARLFSSNHLSEQEMLLINGGGQVAEAYAVAVAYAVVVAYAGRSQRNFAIHYGRNNLLDA